MTPSTLQQAAEMRCRQYVGENRNARGETLPVELDELLRECRAMALCRNTTRDQLMHALRWGGWIEDDGFWVAPKGVENA